MKHLIVVILSLLVCVIVCASALSESAPTLLDKNKITIVARDAYFEYNDTWKEYKLIISYNVINESAYDYDISSSEGYINGWQVEGHTHAVVDAGMKKKDDLYLRLEDVEMLSAQDLQNLEDVSIKFNIHPANGFYPDQIYTEKVDVEWIKQKVAEHK